jgi:polysaccharide biosynthesis protein PslH
MARRTLLFATDVVPYPLDRGQRVRVHNLLLACDRAFDVTFVGPRPESEADRRTLERTCRRVEYVGDVAGGWGQRASVALSTARAAPGIPRPSTIRQYAPMVDALQRANPGAFDLVWAERPHIARLCARQRTRTVLDLDDLEHVKIARSSALRPALRDRARSAYRYAFFRHLEISWARRFLASVVCSEEDRSYLERRGCRNVRIVPNAPNLLPAPSSPRRHDAAGPLRVVFLGNVEAEPNRDAIAFFADDLLPLLRKAVPEATLDVIGPNAQDEIVRRYESRICFRGFVSDLGAALAEYDLMIAPLRFGSGTKLKILDAMACGLPVVTTAVGAEGLSLRHRENAWLAEAPANLVDGILAIKRDPELAVRLAEAAARTVRERFSWPAIQDSLAEWLDRVTPVAR